MAPYTRAMIRTALSASDLASYQGSIFIPTMGGLHAGHQALIDQARTLVEAGTHPGPIVVSVFVNPTQFDQPQDYQRYPRTLEHDLRICEAAGADVVYTPESAEVYPPDQPIEMPPLPDVIVEKGLEDKARPGHLEGVCQVVKRLFELVEPTAAIFGEKDWQQYRAVSDMSRDLNLGVRIIMGPTVREHDGLALNSRNRFLKDEDRPKALSLSAALRAARDVTDPDEAEYVMASIMTDAGLTVEYAAVRDAQTLTREKGQPPAGPARCFVAGRLSDTLRMLDNAPWQAV